MTERLKHRLVAKVRPKGISSSLLRFRRKTKPVVFETTEGEQKFPIPVSAIDGPFVRLRVASVGDAHVTCILPESGRRLVAFPRDQVILEES